ncbi:MAG: RNA methyltransferase [Phycisphaerales bacterium]|nr:RNA methyltransferase [Phycisphaerales bacterium]
MIDRFTPIHDQNDPRIEPYRNQKDAWLKASHNPNAIGQPTKDPLFISEGSLVLQHHINSPYKLHSVLIAESKIKAHADLLAKVPQEVPIYTASRQILDHITGYPIHRGLLAAGHRIKQPDLTSLLKTARALVILQDLANHDNLGSIFRSVAALCGSGVPILLSPKCCDPLYRKSLRVSMGHALTIPFATLPKNKSWPAILTTLKTAGFTTLAMTPAQDAVDINTLPQNNPPHTKYALLLGAEGPGLTPQAINASDLRVKIPLATSADSLNISVAAAVALHRLIPPLG